MRKSLIHPLAKLFLNNSFENAQSPTEIENFRLKDSPDILECVELDSTVPVLKTDKGIKYVQTPDERFNNLKDYSYKPNYAVIDGLKMHYVDDGPQDGEVVLLLHGQPSWSYLYRKMIPTISKAGFRAIAVDHIGMGKSDKPVDIGIHTFEQHVKWLKFFIESLKLTNITLFCQDWGSLFGLRVAGDLPHIFARIVVANGTLPVINKGSNPFKIPNPVKIDCTLGPFDSLFKKFNPRKVTFIRKHPKLMQLVWARFFQTWIKYTLTAPNFTPSQVLQRMSYITLAPEELKAYDAPYPSHIFKAAVRTFPSMVTAIEENNLLAWENLGKFTKPFLFLGGELDGNMGKMENQIRLTTHIPGAKGQEHERYEHANHFIQEDAGFELGKKVVEFMTMNPLTD